MGWRKWLLGVFCSFMDSVQLLLMPPAPANSSCLNVQSFLCSLSGPSGQHRALVNIIELFGCATVSLLTHRLAVLMWLALSSTMPGARVHAAHICPKLGVQSGLAPGLLSVHHGGSSGILGVSLACQALSSQFLRCCSRSLGWSLPQILSFKTH